jgi:hypothetical protein
MRFVSDQRFLSPSMAGKRVVQNLSFDSLVRDKHPDAMNVLCCCRGPSCIHADLVVSEDATLTPRNIELTLDSSLDRLLAARPITCACVSEVGDPRCGDEGQSSTTMQRRLATCQPSSNERVIGIATPVVFGERIDSPCANSASFPCPLPCYIFFRKWNWISNKSIADPNCSSCPGLSVSACHETTLAEVNIRDIQQSWNRTTIQI